MIAKYSQIERNMESIIPSKRSSKNTAAEATARRREIVIDRERGVAIRDLPLDIAMATIVKNN